MKRLLAFAALALASFAAFAAPPLVASCPSQTNGTAFPVGTFLVCTPAAVYVAPTPSTIVAALVGGVSTWRTAGTLAQTDSVWGQVAQPGTTSNWWPVSLMGWTTVTPPAPGTHKATVTWNPVTKDTSGAALTVPIVYNVYRGASSATLAVVGSKVAEPYADTGIPDGSYVWAVTALCADAAVCLESAKTPTSAAVTFKAASAPVVTCAAPSAPPAVAPLP